MKSFCREGEARQPRRQRKQLERGVNKKLRQTSHFGKRRFGLAVKLHSSSSQPSVYKDVPPPPRFKALVLKTVLALLCFGTLGR